MTHNLHVTRHNRALRRYYCARWLPCGILAPGLMAAIGVAGLRTEVPEMARDRLSVTVSYPMRVALERMADRTGLHVTSLAASLLRGALDKELRDPAVRARVREHTAARTVGEWREETGAEVVVESLYRAAKEKGVVGDDGQSLGPGGAAPIEAGAKAAGRRRALRPMAGKE